MFGLSVSWNWALVIIGGILILLEVMAGGFAGFDLVLIGSAFILGGVGGLVFQSATVGIVLAAVLCLAYIFVGRRWVRSRMRRPSIPSNTDALINRKAMVTERIAPHEPGRVKLDDEEWRALAVEADTAVFEPGTEVTIESIDGVTLRVR
jgi:membrane protein implicated in regulation of membrane protease activity